MWLPALQRAGLDRVGFHDLRRACATALVARGVDLKTAQNRLRHADARMTIGLYAAAEVQADRDAADLLGVEFLVRPKQMAKDAKGKEAK